MSPSWHRPQLSVRERRARNFGDSCDAGHLASHNSLLHLLLTSQAVSCVLEFSVAKCPSLSKVC